MTSQNLALDYWQAQEREFFDKVFMQLNVESLTIYDEAFDNGDEYRTFEFKDGTAIRFLIKTEDGVVCLSPELQYEVLEPEDLNIL